MPGQTLVDIRIIGSQQLHHAAIFPQLAGDEKLRLLRHGIAQVLVELPIQIGIGNDPGKLTQAEPAVGEAIHQRPRAWVVKHALNLLIEDFRFMQATGDSQVAQLVVGNTAPKKERQPRRQIQIAQTVDRVRRGILRRAFNAK